MCACDLHHGGSGPCACSCPGHRGHRREDETRTTRREWKTGDVAMVNGRVCMRVAKGWEHGDERAFPYAHTAVDVRPLVVIDPESTGADYERVWIALRDGRALQSRENLRTSLRSLIEPPKPPEPTAMWSVVEEVNEDQWVRVLGPDFLDGWVRAGDLPSNGKWTCYADIPAVRVVSEGVTADV